MSLGLDAFSSKIDSGSHLFYQTPGLVRTSEEDWYDTFCAVAIASDLIFSVPLIAGLGARGRAALAELLFIYEHDLLDKTVFLMPPEQDIDIGLASSVKCSELWGSACGQLNTLGIPLPIFEPDHSRWRIIQILQRDVRIWPVECENLQSTLADIRKHGTSWIAKESELD